MIVRNLRSLAIAILALMFVAGATFAVGPKSHAPDPAKTHPTPEVEAAEPPESEQAESPTGDVIALVVAKFALAGITTTPAEVTELAAEYGLGGAVRIITWANDSGKTVAEIVALREAGKGWGQIGKDLGLSPGNGSIMNGDHGKGKTKVKP